MDVFYATLNSDGSIDVNSNFFNENDIKIGEENIIMNPSLIKSVDVIHTEYVPEKTNDSKNKNKAIIIVCCLIGTVILVVIAIFVITFILKRKQKINKSVSESSLFSSILLNNE